VINARKSSSEKDLVGKRAALAEEVEAMVASQKAVEEEHARLQATSGMKDALMNEREQSKAAAEQPTFQQEQSAA
jgi:hypothetical protein